MRILAHLKSAVAGLAISVVISTGAHAQGTDASANANAPANSSVPGDIVVTAQKRVSTVQKTAVAMTVFDNKTLERNGVQGIQDLTKLAPSVSLGQNSANVLIAVRGVSSRDTNEIGDPAVAVSQDGFSVQRPTGLADSIYDLERIEVLRGPQGTLYGRSATGGAINFITAKPTDKYEGRFGVGYGAYNELTTEGMFNAPVSDTLSMRAAFSTRRHDGYRTDETTRAGDDADSTSGRLSLQWKPVDRLKVLLTGQYTHVGGVGPTVEGFAYTTVNPNYVPTLLRNGTAHSNPNQYIDTTTKQLQGEVDYDLDFATLMYVGGYRNMHYHQLRDLDGTTSAANYYQPNENPQDIQNEVRLVSNGNGKFKWQVGANTFWEGNSDLTYYQTYATSASPVNRYVFDYYVVAKSRGVFGQASYEVLPNVTVEAGTRYSYDDKTRIGYQNLGSGNQPENSKFTSDKMTYHGAVNWQATPRNLLYVKYDTGYKPGGFTTVLGVGVFTYQPETISAVEVGSKNRFLDNKLTVNVSAFHYNYNNQQVSVANTTAAGQGATYTTNAGKSEIYGGELESNYQITPADRFDLSVSYLHARFKDFCTVRAVDGSCTNNFAGNSSVQAPDWQINAGLQHDFTFMKGTLTPRIQTHYETHSYLGVENYAYERQNAYTRSDVMFTYTAPSGKWTAQAYVRNLENTIVITTANASFGSYNYGLAAPRTYGAKLTYNW